MFSKGLIKHVSDMTFKSLTKDVHKTTNKIIKMPQVGLGALLKFR